MINKEITEAELIRRKNEAQHSKIKYNPEDLENICTDPNGIVGTINNMPIKLKIALPRLPSPENIRGILYQSAKLKTGYKKQVKSKTGFMTSRNFKTIVDLKDVDDDFDFSQVESLCLPYKCGKSRCKTLSLGSISVLYTNECCVHNFCIECYYPEITRNKLFPLHSISGTTDCTLNVYQVMKYSFKELNNWPEFKIKAFIKCLQQVSQAQIKCCDVEKEFHCQRHIFFDIAMYYYYLTNKKNKFVTEKAQQQGIFCITNSMLSFMGSLRTSNDLMIQSHMKSRDAIIGSHPILLKMI